MESVFFLSPIKELFVKVVKYFMISKLLFKKK